MSKITQLSVQLSNMIAAGEVVEGPFSVVKELVENSIDANSSKIEIYLTNAGTTCIEVIDDGDGMDKEDANLCFSRHATSKIKNEGDLFRISSLGFRGEAIPSIASVSHFSLYTKMDNEEGVFVKYEFGKKTNESTYALSKGSKIVIEKLFFNTPARLKYLKSENSILGAIAELITKLSIAHPDKSFKLSNNNTIITQSFGKSNMKNLLANIYGVAIAKSIFENHGETNGIKASLYYAKPEFTRSRKNEITTIVNKRYVKSTLLINAVVDAYKNFIPQGRYPICAIILEVDPLLIDVNVHPAKMEIKFSLEDEIYSLIKRLILDNLSVSNLIPEYSNDLLKPNYKTNILQTIQKEEAKTSNLSDVTKETTSIKTNLFDQENSTINLSNSNVETKISINENENISYEDNINLEVRKEALNKPRLPYLEYAGNIFGTFLIFQNDEGAYLIDQHAAQERIKYEHYYKVFSNPPKETIEMLIPLQMDFTVEETMLLSSNYKVLNEAGIEFEQVGPTNFLVRSVPTWIKQGDSYNLIEKIVSFLIDKKDFNIGAYRDALAKMVSCKESIKANFRISQDDAMKLYEELKLCENPFTCPHGRPSIIKLSVYEIEKMFKRIV